ncbi:hypothetical protein NG697_12345 [Pseudarthrobacter sp. MDT3-26]|uniref:hypothetical protein n=1 Tax=Pseudarthrobacter raffinosi TaxID=2953651 RepID=UPI00208EDBFC|nr:hypothetical protein [Pseudarthrobacter sp. MDT3-26]MCO4263701.1 hypothetical protein [Pseudarthrobacter sp. MDT3-26]
MAAMLGFIIVRSIFNPLNYQSDKPLAILAFFIFLCVMLLVSLRSGYRGLQRSWNKLPDPVSPSSFLLKATFLLALAVVLFCAEVVAVSDLISAEKITVAGTPDLRALVFTVVVVSIPALALGAAGTGYIVLYVEHRTALKKGQ